MLMQAIETYNKSTSHPIDLRPTRDGRVTAVLPHVGKEVLVQADMFNKVSVTAADVALVCKEARLEMAPALALLDAALEQASSEEPA